MKVNDYMRIDCNGKVQRFGLSIFKETAARLLSQLYEELMAVQASANDYGAFLDRWMKNDDTQS